MKKLTLSANKENLSKLTDFLDEFLNPYDVMPKTQIQLELAVEEIFVNICSYAYAESGGTVNISFEILPEPFSLRITFEDTGKPYNPLARTDPDITLEAEKRQIGGLGVFLVKQVMDKCDYEYKNKTNVFSIEKHLN